MRKYMWLNSCLPSATGLITAAQTGSQGRFTLEGVENHAARKYFFQTRIISSSSYFQLRLPPHALRMGKALGGEFDTKYHSERLSGSERYS